MSHSCFKDAFVVACICFIYSLQKCCSGCLISGVLLLFWFIFQTHDEELITMGGLFSFPFLLFLNVFLNLCLITHQYLRFSFLFFSQYFPNFSLVVTNSHFFYGFGADSCGRCSNIGEWGWFSFSFLFFSSQVFLEIVTLTFEEYFITTTFDFFDYNTAWSIFVGVLFWVFCFGLCLKSKCFFFQKSKCSLFWLFLSFFCFQRFLKFQQPTCVPSCKYAIYLLSVILFLLPSSYSLTPKCLKLLHSMYIDFNFLILFLSRKFMKKMS